MAFEADTFQAKLYSLGLLMVMPTLTTLLKKGILNPRSCPDVEDFRK